MSALLSKFLTKRLALLFTICFLLFTISSKPLHAFSTPNATYQFQFEQAIQTPEMNLQSFVYETIKALAGSGVTATIGCLTCPKEQGETGMIQTISFFIASIYASPPASGVQYLADLGNQFGLAKPAYAQGLGFEQMRPFLNIWKAFRNLTYLFFVLIFIFIGFAIMFRVKISPQAVITIQSSLPKIIIGLILVTFSYAIVGFLIDIMWVINNLIIVTFKTLPIFNVFIDIVTLGPILGPVTSTHETLWVLLVSGLLTTIAIFSMLILVMLGGAVASGPLAPLIAPGMALINIAVLLILAIVFLIALIRVFWMLLKAYVFVVLSLIFGPFQILVGILPGSNAIGSWFRNLLANLAVLPITLTMILLSGYLAFAGIPEVLRSLLGEFLKKGGSESLIADIGRFLGESAAAIPAIIIVLFISMGILLMTPKIADMIQAFLAGKPFAYGAAIGEAIPGLGIGRKAAEEWLIKKQAFEGFPIFRKAAERIPRPKVSETEPTEVS